MYTDPRQDLENPSTLRLRESTKPRGDHTYRKHQPAGGPSDASLQVIESPYGLSGRELIVLFLVSEGLSDRQIGLALGVTPYTVNKHVGAILAKMNVRSRTAAAVAAIRKHLFEDDIEGVILSSSFDDGGDHPPPSFTTEY